MPMNDLNQLNEHQRTMAALAAEASQVFGCYPAPDRLTLLGDPHHDHALEAALCRTPLAELSVAQFRDFYLEFSVEPDSAREFLYFLPRILDLLAQGERLSLVPERVLSGLKPGVAAGLGQEQTSVLNRFVLAYFRNWLGPNQWRAQAGVAWNDSVEVLAMVHFGGLDIQPLLDEWAQTDDIRASRHFAIAGYWSWWGPCAEPAAYEDEAPAFAQQIRAWLQEPATRARFIEKLQALEFKALVTALQPDQPQSLREMVDLALQKLNS